jgi:hypothetical protein
MFDDPKLTRLVELHQQAVVTMAHEQARRTNGHDRVVLDVDQGRAAYLREGFLQWNPRAELVGILMTDIERWRWWWVMPGAETGAKDLRLNAAFAAGQRAGIETLTSRNPKVANEKQALVLARLCAALAGAQGVHVERAMDRVTYYALFDAAPGERSNEQQYTTQLPPAPSTRRPPADGVGMEASLPQLGSVRAPLSSVALDAPPPPSGVGGAAGTPALASMFPPPATSALARAPDRTLVRAVAHCAHQLVRHELPAGFRQAVVVVYVEIRGAKLRFSSHLVATDRNAELIVLDPSPQLMRAVEDLVAEDVRSGNGRWTRLTIRLTATATGASLDVQVKS